MQLPLASWVTHIAPHQPSSVGTASGGSSSPSYPRSYCRGLCSRAKRTYFFFPCMSAWRCNLGFSASAACRYSFISFMSSGKMLSHRSLQGFRVPVFACQPLLRAILGSWQETLILVAELFSRLTLPLSLCSLPGTIGVSLFSLARRSGAWRERGGPTVCAGPSGAPGCGQSPGPGGAWAGAAPMEEQLLAAGRGNAWPQGRARGRGCVGQCLCPMGQQGGRFLRCLRPTSSGPAASLKPSSSRAQKAAKAIRCAFLCRENTAVTRSVPARERELTGSRGP